MLGSLFFMISPSVATSLLAEGSHTGTKELFRKTRASLLIIAALLVPTMLFFLVADRLLLEIFGFNYASAGVELLIILTLSAVPDAFSTVYIRVLRVQGRLREAALLNLGMALLCLSLAWVLLPLNGIAGAGWAWIIAQSVGGVYVVLDLVLQRRRT